MNELCSCVEVDTHVVGGRVVGFDAQVRDSRSGVKVVASPRAVSAVQHVSEVLSAQLGTILCEIPAAEGRSAVKTWILTGHNRLRRESILHDNQLADRTGRGRNGAT